MIIPSPPTLHRSPPPRPAAAHSGATGPLGPTDPTDPTAWRGGAQAAPETTGGWWWMDDMDLAGKNDNLMGFQKS